MLSQNYQTPSWPESGRYRHAAMLALFDHLITKTACTYGQRSHSAMRVFAIIEILQHHYDDAGAFGTFGFMKKNAIGKFPRYAIDEASHMPGPDLDKIGNDLLTNGLYTDT